MEVGACGSELGLKILKLRLYLYLVSNLQLDRFHILSLGKLGTKQAGLKLPLSSLRRARQQACGNLGLRVVTPIVWDAAHTSLCGTPPGSTRSSNELLVMV